MTRTAAALAIAALLAPSAGAHERRPRDKGDTAGAALAGALLAGGLVALLAAKQRAPDAPLTETTPDENDAANACAQAAEEQMWNEGREARVEHFAAVTARGKGGYTVKGDIRVADAGDGYRMRFRCVVQGLAVRSVTLSI